MTEERKKYKAFICYKHKDIENRSQQLAQKLRKNLEHYGIPPSETSPSPDIFIDEEELLPGDPLSSKIQDALENSEYLLYLASPAAAESYWVQEELRIWCDVLQKGRKLIVVLVDGEIVYRKDNNEIDWVNTKVLPDILRNYYSSDYIHLDLTPVRKQSKMRIGNSIFENVIIDIAAKLRNIKNKNEIRKEVDEEKAKIKKRKTVVFSFIALFALMAFTAAVFAFIQDKKSQIMRVTTEALLEQSKDNTKAVRIAEAAYKFEVPIVNIPTAPATYRAISSTGYSSFEKSFYLSKFEHRTKIQYITFSPDGSLLFTATEDGEVKIWDVAHNKILLNLLEPENRDIKASFSPDNRNLLLTTTRDKGAKLFKLDGNIKADLAGKHKKKLTSVGFSPKDGKLIITASQDGTAILWSGEGIFKKVIAQHDSGINTAVFSNDDTQVLTASWDGTAKLSNIDGTPSIDLIHEKSVSTAVFSKDDKYIITASEDHTSKLWDRQGNMLHHLVGHEEEVFSAKFSPDCSKILTVSKDRTARLWDINGEIIRILDGHKEPIFNAYFSLDNNRVLTASADKIILWDLSGLQVGEYDFKCSKNGIVSAFFSPIKNQIAVTFEDGSVEMWEHENKIVKNLNHNRIRVNAAVFSHNGDKVLTVASDSVARLWNWEGRFLKSISHRGNQLTAAFSDSGNKILTANGSSLKVWDLDGKCLDIFNCPDGTVITSALFSRDEKRILAASDNGIGYLWDLKSKKEKNLKHKKAITSISFSPDGSKILSASLDGTVKLWFLDGEEIKTIEKHKGPVNSAVFSYDGLRILTASQDKTAKIFDLQANMIADFEHLVGVKQAIFSPTDEYVLIIAGRTATVWTADGELKSELDLHRKDILSAKFSPDGSRIISTSKDETAKMWNLSGELLADLSLHRKTVNTAVFSPDNRLILTASDDGTAKLWYTPESIIEWLESAHIRRLSKRERRKIGL